MNQLETPETEVMVEDPKKARKNRIITTSINICCHMSFLIAIIVVLSIDDHSCTYPIRAWLVLYGASSIVGTICSFLIEILSKKDCLEHKKLSILYTIYYLSMVLFFIIWTILGSVWVYKDDECQKRKF